MTAAEFLDSTPKAMPQALCAEDFLDGKTGAKGPGPNGTSLVLDPSINLDLGVNQPSQYSSGYFDGTANLQNESVPSFVVMCHEPPGLDRIFSKNRSIASLSGGSICGFGNISKRIGQASVR